MAGVQYQKWKMGYNYLCLFETEYHYVFPYDLKLCSCIAWDALKCRETQLPLPLSLSLGLNVGITIPGCLLFLYSCQDTRIRI